MGQSNLTLWYLRVASFAQNRARQLPARYSVYTLYAAMNVVT